MKIRLKVKHLVLLLLLPAALLITLFLTFNPSRADQENRAALSSETSAREQLLQQINAATGSKRMELIQEKVLDTAHNDFPSRFDVYIGASMSQTGSRQEADVSPLLPEDRIILLEEYIRKGPADARMVRALKQLATEYAAAGQSESIVETLASAGERVAPSASISRELTLYQAERALDQGDIHSAASILNQVHTSRSLMDAEQGGYHDALLGRVLFAQGKAKEALDVVSGGLTSYREYWKMLDTSIYSGTEAADSSGSTTEMLLKSLQTALRSAMDMEKTQPAAVSGTLTRSDGTPIPRAGVFLRSENEVNHSVTDAEPYRIVTDEQGHFEFHGVIPGFYQLHLGLSFEQVDGYIWPTQPDDWLEIKPGEQVNKELVLQPLLELKSPVNQVALSGQKVNFEWEAVKGAAYYTLTGHIWPKDGGSNGSVIREQIEGNQISIPVDELYYKSTGISYGSKADWQSLEPASILGFMSPGRLSWSVDAYDAEGNLLTRSNGYRLDEDTMGNLPFFTLQKRTLTAADRLLLDHKLDQALEAYRQDYDNNPQDVHALHMLYRMKDARASINEDKQEEAETLPLLKQLMLLQPNEDYAFTLSHFFYKQKDWVSYNKYYAQYLQLSGQEPNEYVRSVHATALMQQGKLDEARQQFAIALEQDDSHRFIGSFLAAELYAGAPLHAVLELAERYPDHSFGGSGNRWPLMIGKLISAKARHPELFEQQLQEKLQWYVEGQEDRLEQWIEQSTDSALKAFMKAVLAVG
ncbi:carboxypeptidase regulatory-like domain-containing protein [Paenibacillus albidus]|uniref:carboxypeptidase-like regulatory domain-containing protein n=1 Tax=Paenibacillus albidus TaxID=2041023 RepID=UPI001BEAB97C|nr:carboxypeptidase-like regulatory domain-containing protein [Paenibacillus albidus]MBT2291020.1 carboxypeptidase regulatory-like domain-containing protein [Paenibacillus albidus]